MFFCFSTVGESHTDATGRHTLVIKGDEQLPVAGQDILREVALVVTNLHVTWCSLTLGVYLLWAGGQLFVEKVNLSLRLCNTTNFVW